MSSVFRATGRTGCQLSQNAGLPWMTPSLFQTHSCRVSVLFNENFKCLDGWAPSSASLQSPLQNLALKIKPLKTCSTFSRSQRDNPTHCDPTGRRGSGWKTGIHLVYLYAQGADVSQLATRTPLMASRKKPPLPWHNSPDCTHLPYLGLFPVHGKPGTSQPCPMVTKGSAFQFCFKLLCKVSQKTRAC